MASLLFLKTVMFTRAMHRNKRKQTIRKETSQKQVIQSALCRICNEGKADIPIFDCQEDINIPEEVKQIAGVTILRQDKYSKHICQSCLQLLKGCILFREMCQNTNKELTEVAIKKENKSNIEEQISIIHEEEDTFHPVASPRSDEVTPQFVCSACSKEFAKRSSYICHVKKCKSQNSACKKTGRQTYLCEICGKTTQSNAHLMIHMVIHENVFPFKCDVCPYRGKRLDLLKVHKRTHLTDKPFKCQYCPKSTTTASNLTQHIQNVHSNNRPFKCTFCARGFPSKCLMVKHVKAIHLKQETVDCNICFKTFSSKKVLRGHQYKIHKVKAIRHGRMPAYLQAQELENCENRVAICNNPNITENYL